MYVLFDIELSIGSCVVVAYPVGIWSCTLALRHFSGHTGSLASCRPTQLSIIPLVSRYAANCVDMVTPQLLWFGYLTTMCLTFCQSNRGHPTINLVSCRFNCMMCGRDHKMGPKTQELGPQEPTAVAGWHCVALYCVLVAAPAAPVVIGCVEWWPCTSARWLGAAQTLGPLCATASSERRQQPAL